MEYVSDRDYNYIMNKYHDTSKPFDPLRRFVRNDAVFSPETGLDGDVLKEKLVEFDRENSHLSHPLRKALAIEFVLKNTRISCDCRDIFPNINALDRPIDASVTMPWRREVLKDIASEAGKQRSYYESTGLAYIYPDYDHSMPVWERIFDLGLVGILERSENIRASRSLTKEEDDFFESIRISYSAVIDFCKRLAELAGKTPHSEKMATALKNIATAPPSTFYEALLLDYVYFIINEHVDGLQVRSLGNFDRLFYRYYLSDLESGVSENELRRDLAYFLLQFTAIANYWNQPVYLGGENEDGSTVINELSYLFLDVYDKMGIYNPKIQIKLSSSTPKKFVLKALDMIRRGHNCIVFVCDETIRAALQNRGVSAEDARCAKVTGCYEYGTQGGFGTGMNSVNLMKPLEYALHKGCDGVTGVFASLPSPDVSEYSSFAELFDEYKKQLKFVIDGVIGIVNGFEDHLAYGNPLPILSATFDTCLERGRDAIGGGAKTNGSGMSFGFIANVADSLAMIKKYVFDKKYITLTELVKNLDNNFEQNENLRLRLLRDPDKFGNNRDLPDSIARDIADFIVKNTVDRPNSRVRGGKWSCSFHVARMSYTAASKTATSADGRLIGEELSKNISPSMGQNREGATAAILSATKIDATSFTGDACLDLGLLPSAVSGDDGLEAMYALLLTFHKRRGHALHINVFDAQTLRDAQKNPDKYRDLQIRVCGWNVLWNNINKEEQDGFIRQAEALI